MRRKTKYISNSLDKLGVRASSFFSLANHKILVFPITYLYIKSTHDMDSMAPRALKGKSTECRQTRQRSNGQFLIHASACEHAHVLTGYEGELSQDMMVLWFWRVSPTGSTCIRQRRTRGQRCWQLWSPRQKQQNQQMWVWEGRQGFGL